MNEDTPINIWGKPGCELPNGGLCVACCQYFTIPAFDSPAGRLCEHVVPGQGCRIIFDANNPDLIPLIPLRNGQCAAFHCSNADRTERGHFMNIARRLGQVTLDEYLRAA